ncbi:MAG: HAMP domain-containing protein, partial [Nitrospirae bacterium]|nr:HAMP domain-containing protein [Nitrospirota bacterium]
MWIIIIFYVAFLIIGLGSVYAGHSLLSKNVINPIKELAAATTEFSEGMFGKRVHTHSKTEIGLLYQSFNKMAEKLEEHNKLLKSFNEELEKKVMERTEALQATNEQLRKTQNALIRTEKIAAIGQIAAGVAHEVKNPLNSLSINIQLLLREVLDKFGSDSPFYESASIIKSELNRINNIVEEFVKFAKFPEPNFIQDNINKVITEVADIISHKAKDSGITVKLSLKDNIPVFKFDAKQFKTVLINLSLNSIDAMREGGILEMKTALRDKDIIIYVSDNGRGFQEKDLGNIFSPFFSTKEGGLGLGLSIVQKIVENHGGKIKCTSKVGEGTTFEIILPIERD